MNNEQFEKVQDDAVNRVRSQIKDLSVAVDGLHSLAKSSVEDAMENALQIGQAYRLQDEEERMLLAYRQFKVGAQPNEVFAWKYVLDPDQSPIAVPDGKALLVTDPRYVKISRSMGKRLVAEQHGKQDL